MPSASFRLRSRPTVCAHMFGTPQPTFRVLRTGGLGTVCHLSVGFDMGENFDAIPVTVDDTLKCRLSTGAMHDWVVQSCTIHW